MGNKFISFTQLAGHNTGRDLWVAVHGKVYDLTTFATDHPGGIDVLEECAGTDGTEPYDYAGHSADALTALARFQVGMLENYCGSAHAGPSKAARLAQRKDDVVTVMHQAWNVARTRGFLLLLALLMAARLCLGAGIIGSTSIQPDGSRLRPATAFTSGLVVASLASVAGLAVVYSQFSKTLRQEKEVFAYPSVIPVRR